VVWSEGLRAMAALYDERDTEGWGADRRAGLPADSGAAYQRYLADCAAYGAAGRPPAEPAAPRRTTSDSGLLGAGAVLGGVPAGPDEETLTALRLDWPVLDEGHHLVRLVPGRAVEGEAAVARALGLLPATAGAVPVGRVRVRPLDFLAQVSRVHPQHARQAMALLAPLRRCAETAPAKPGRAATQLQQALAKLTATTPELLPFALYEGAKVVAGAGSPAMAAPLFTEARRLEESRLEESQGGRVDEDAVEATFAEFIRLGVVSAKLLQEYRQGLAARLSPAETADRYLRLVLVWCRAGREAPRSLAGDLARAADGAALPADEDHTEILDALLHRGGMDKAPLAVWQSWEPALAALTARSPAAARRALRLMAAPRGTSAAARAATAEGWLELLRRTGLLSAVTGEPAHGTLASSSSSSSGPAAPGERDARPGPAAPPTPASPGELASPAEVKGWLGLFLEQYQGMKQPVAGLDAALAAVARRLREAGEAWQPPRGLTAHGQAGPAVDLDLLALMSRAGIPWAEPYAHGSLDVVRWLAAKGPAAVEEIAADPVLRPLVARELVVRGHGREKHVAGAHPLAVAPRGLAALRRSRPLTTVVEEGAEELAQRLHGSGGTGGTGGSDRLTALLDLLVLLEPLHAAGLTGPFAGPAKEAAGADAAALLAEALSGILGGGGRDVTVPAGCARELLDAVGPEVHEECRDRIVRGRAGQHVYTATATSQALAGLVVRIVPDLPDDAVAARHASTALQQALVCEIRQEDLRKHLA
jgi:hypothetical protein